MNDATATISLARSSGVETFRHCALGNLVSFLPKGEDTGGKLMLTELTE